MFVIMAAPFPDDGTLDLRSADRLVEFCLEEGVHGFTLLGVMGEAPKLSLDEQAAFTCHVLKRIDGLLDRLRKKLAAAGRPFPAGL